MFHGYIPVNLKTEILVHVLKSKVEIEMFCEQFRLITIVLILSTVLECCVLHNCKSSLITHANQLGYKKNGGCEKAICYVTSVVNYLCNVKLKFLIQCLMKVQHSTW